MNQSILIFCLLISSVIFCQSKKEILSKKWKINKIEEFGQEYSPSEKQKNDWIEFSPNGKFKGIIDGYYVEGTWSVSDNKVIISVNKKLSKIKINWTKVKVLEKDKFALEYQNGDLITALLLFIPDK